MVRMTIIPLQNGNAPDGFDSGWRRSGKTKK
jgi:hypothetical protein